MNRSVFRSNYSVVVIALTLLMLANGCNRGPKTGTISGKVTFQGVPIPGGTIAFISRNGMVASANIQEGNFTITALEVGPGARITVSSHPPSPMMVPPTGPVDGQAAYDPKHFVQIPDKYKDLKSSGLTYDVVEGTQTRDFDLQP